MEEPEKEVIVTKIISSETVKDMDESKEIENLKKIEAALFLSARFLNLQELVWLTDINPLMLKELLDRLVEKYNNEGCAIEIVIRENMWKMDVCKEHVDMINKLATGSSEFSKAEQETLAVVAYKQPVKQSVIINIRGNKAYDHVKKFIENGLVIGKRLGHTKELKLSDDFFEYFHLQNKDGKMEIEKNDEGDELVEEGGEVVEGGRDVGGANVEGGADESGADVGGANKIVIIEDNNIKKSENTEEVKEIKETEE